VAGEYDHGKTTFSKGQRAVTRSDTPFPRHWLYYITLKYVVLAAAFLIALYVAYQLW
jgi:hypothetical protein